MKKLLAIMLMLLPMFAWGRNEHNVRVDSESSEAGVGTFIDNGIKINDFQQIGLGVLARYNEVLGFFLYNESTTKHDCITPKEVIVLLKLKSGKIIRSQSSGNGTTWKTKKQKMYLFHHRISFFLTREQMDEILQYGIEKIRFAVGMEQNDIELSSEDNAYLTESVVRLRETVSQNKGLYDDF